MTFIKHHKHHFRAFVILIIIAGISGYFAFKTPDASDRIQNTDNRIPAFAKATAGKPDSAQATVDKQNTTSTQKTNTDNFLPKADHSLAETTQSASTKATTGKQLNNPITVRVDDKNYQAEFASSTTVYDLMNKLKYENKISFSGKEYTGMGMFVDEINGVKNDNLAGKYWIYYINSESAQVGISNYTIKQGDLIEWKYETTNL